MKKQTKQLELRKIRVMSLSAMKNTVAGAAPRPSATISCTYTCMCTSNTLVNGATVSC